MKLSYQCVDLPLEHVFTIARGSRTVQHSLIVELEHEGMVGYGEATEHAYYGVSREEMIASLEGCRQIIETQDKKQLPELWNNLKDKLSDQMFLLAAIDAAAHDLIGKLDGQATYERLGLEWRNIPRSSFTIGIDSIDQMLEKMLGRKEWPIFKIKLGTDQDVEIIKRLREHTKAIFRVDANCGWSAEETVQNSIALSELNVEFIEQPLPADASEEDQLRVYQESSLPIIADESCQTEADVDTCRGKFHGINVKLSKCGGITPGMRMLLKARSYGLKTMVGCMVESTVGISAAAQLCPLLDYADLDGAELLKVDTAEGVKVHNGQFHLPHCHGNGVELHQEVVLTQ